MRRVGVKGRYGQVGTQEFLQQEYGLTAAHIVAAADELLTPHPNPYVLIFSALAEKIPD
ncbi:hypothetical protein D3C78_1353900 [compost metagenome]